MAEASNLLQSPIKPRYTDRFVPSRVGKAWDLTFPETPTKKEKVDGNSGDDVDHEDKIDSRLQPEDEKINTYAYTLKNEVLGYDYDPQSILLSPQKCSKRKLFHYDSNERPMKNLNSDRFSPYSASPVSSSTQKLLKTPLRRLRRIPKTPYKILDAPDLSDDFYLNLLDWSSQNVVAVGLGSNIYLWSAITSQVSGIPGLSTTGSRPTSVKWNEMGNLLAIGSLDGHLRVWDVEAQKIIVQSPLHRQRIGAIDWSGETIFTGSRDTSIKQTDIRDPTKETFKFQGHTQEVCGLKYSSFNGCIASGGNDNRVILWSLESRKPVFTLTEHVAAVKALAWSPHAKCILATGGGTQDRCIKFWNTVSGMCINSINTNSQVCNLAWSPHSNEIVSTHGYAQNHVAIWKYPTQKLSAVLKGHTQRVLYMALGPDGESLCTGASDETLRFWKVFEKNKDRVKKSPLDLFDGIR